MAQKTIKRSLLITDIAILRSNSKKDHLEVVGTFSEDQLKKMVFLKTNGEALYKSHAVFSEQYEISIEDFRKLATLISRTDITDTEKLGEVDQGSEIYNEGENNNQEVEEG